jgi:hypothetical protein
MKDIHNTEAGKERSDLLMQQAAAAAKRRSVGQECDAE